MTKIDLVTGFLGAGKTTFLERYGAWLDRSGVRFAVVENEFGAAGVDTAILSERFGNVTELAGGCICCTLKSGFHALLARLAGQCDRILVEPSGLYNLDDFFQVADTLEQDGLCQTGMCLTLIDPHTLPVLSGPEREVLRTELTGTGAVLWTKTDLEPACDLTQAMEQAAACLDLQEEAPLTFYPTPAHALTDADFAALQQLGPVRRKHRPVLLNHAALYQSTSLRPKGVYTESGLARAIDDILGDPALGELVRIKGFVRAADGSLSVNCTVAGRTIAPCGRRAPMLNFIGRGLDRAKIREIMDAYAET